MTPPAGKFSMDDYVDVAERIQVFATKYPDGALQAELEAMHDTSGSLIGWMCKAYAYRTPDDPRPGVGHAFEPVPGKTPYTRDSEAMNAETSAWGRAIVALGFPTKKIASANEVRNRSSSKQPAKKKEAAPPPEDDIPFGPPTTLMEPAPGAKDTLVQIVGSLMGLGKLNEEQIQYAAKTEKPWPDLVDDLSAAQVDDLTSRLAIYLNTVREQAAV